MKKRIFTLLLAVLMLVSLLPLSAFAAPIYESTDILPTAVNSFWGQYPTIEEDSVDVTFYNNWTVGRYTFETGAYDLYDTVNSAQYHTIGVNIENYYMWTQGGGMYLGTWDSGVLALSVPEKYAAQYQYTATHNGTVVFSIEDLYLIDQAAEKNFNPAIDIQLCVNGNKIWPTEGDWYTYTNTVDEYKTNTNPSMASSYISTEHFKETVAFPSAINVTVGSTIEFRVRRNSNNMIAFNPAVKYTQIKDTPEISDVNVTVGGGLALNMFVEMDSANARPGAKVGLYCWTKKPAIVDVTMAKDLPGTKLPGSDLTKFVYEGITSTDMAKELWVLPYSYTEDGGEPYFGNMTVCSISAYAEAVYTATATDAATKDFVRELVNYGANAEAYFDKSGSVAPNEFLTTEEKESTDKLGTDVWAQADDGTTGVIITKASLLLDEKVGLKFVAPAVNGVTTYKMEIATKSDFSDKVEVNMTKTMDGTAYKGIYYIGLGDITTTYYVRVTDGTGYGNTLTYSAESYINRRCEDPDISDKEWYLLSSLLALGYATDILE